MASLTWSSATVSAMGGGKVHGRNCFSLFRELPFLAITPEIYNLRHQAINFVSMYRWDAEKHRVLAELSGPFKANPKFRYGLIANLRGENWDIRDSFQGPCAVAGKFESSAGSGGGRAEVCFGRKRTVALVGRS